MWVLLVICFVWWSDWTSHAAQLWCFHASRTEPGPWHRVFDVSYCDFQIVGFQTRSKDNNMSWFVNRICACCTCCTCCISIQTNANIYIRARPPDTQPAPTGMAPLSLITTMYFVYIYISLARPGHHPSHDCICMRSTSSPEAFSSKDLAQDVTSIHKSSLRPAQDVCLPAITWGFAGQMLGKNYIFTAASTSPTKLSWDSPEPPLWLPARSTLLCCNELAQD